MMPRKPQFPAYLGTLSGSERVWIKGRLDSDGDALGHPDPGRPATPVNLECGAVILTAAVEEICRMPTL
jgi:hypothetical protein